MHSWVSKIGRIVCLNLLHREDRLLQFTKQAEEYGIPFERVSAIYDAEQGARGLRDTMVNLFNEEIAKGIKHLLVFEDDCEMVVPPPIFNDVMDKVMEQLPINYHLCYLGGQASGRFTHFHSANLLPVQKYYATHSVIYSLQGMKEIMARDMQFPIDNWMTSAVQRLGHCYTTHPLLCSQFPGYSDIGKNEINWRPFIVPRHEQKIAEMNGRR